MLTDLSKVLVVVLIVSSLSLIINTLVQGQTEQQQSPPIANPGPDQVVNKLTGTSSFDSDGEIVSYAWGIEDSDDESPPIVLEGAEHTSSHIYCSKSGRWC